MTAGKRVGGFVDQFEIRPHGSGGLDGLRFGLKDIYNIKGRTAGCGNPDWARTHARARQDSGIARALLQAGATFAGMTHTDELAYSLNGENAHYGTPENPAAADRIPGGSSSGSASVTAAGLVDFAIGSDTGGSVRIPASYCGIFGIRTTHGAIPLTGCMPLAPGYDTAGWFARDAATLHQVGDVLLPPATDENPLVETRKWRLMTDPALFNLCDDKTATVLQTEADEHLQAAETVDLMFDAEQSKETFRILQAAEIWETHGDWIQQTGPDFGPGVAERFEMARQITDEQREDARPYRHMLVEQLHGLLGDDGALIVPTAPGPAPFAGTDPADLDVFRYRILALTSLAGHAGLPQITLPCGTVQGAPVGISVIGPAASDRSLLRLVADWQAT